MRRWSFSGGSTTAAGERPSSGGILPVRAWLLAHGCTWAPLAGILCGMVLAAVAMTVGLPRVAPSTVLLDDAATDPAAAGLAVQAGVCGAAALLLRDRLAWITDVSTRSIVLRRLAWGFTLTVLLAAVSGIACLLLPRGLDPVHVFLSFPLFWWGLAMMALVLWGSTAGTVLPLAVSAVFALSLMPWEANVLFNADLLGARLGVGAALWATGMVLYAVRGARRQRGVRDDAI